MTHFSLYNNSYSLEFVIFLLFVGIRVSICSPPRVVLHHPVGAQHYTKPSRPSEARDGVVERLVELWERSSRG